MKRCKQCLVPESVPGISLSNDDVCNLCLDKETLETVVAKEEEAVGMIIRGFLDVGIKGIPEELRKEIEDTIEQTAFGM